MEASDLKAFLDEKAQHYESPAFIQDDPIQIPHRYTRKADIEIASFLVASIAWGNRKSIINNGHKMMRLLEDSPHDFVLHHSEKELKSLQPFVHRTFNGDDFSYFIRSLRHLYKQHGGLEGIFSQYAEKTHLQHTIHHFHHLFFSLPHQQRTRKHVANPAKGSAAKRINMFLRWMVRPAKNQVDFGLWKTLSPAQLSCPLDVHSGNVARKLNLLQRKQNDAKAVLALDTSLRQMDSEDPVKYDFALFGLGVFEQF